MITHADMTGLYGEDGVFRLSREDAETLELREADARILYEVGLPAHSEPWFTIHVDESRGPEFMEVFDIDSAKVGKQREVVLGGPPGDGAMRYSVNAGEGFIMLATFSTPPRGEIVNNDLTTFATFLHAFDAHRARAAADPSVAAESFAELSARLKELDPWSFERPEDWWRMALGYVESES